jgi:hypothetical protein
LNTGRIATSRQRTGTSGLSAGPKFIISLFRG